MNRVTFGASCAYATGSGSYSNPTISMNNNQMVVKAFVLRSKIYSNVGTLEGPAMGASSGAGYVADGSSPSIALMNNLKIVLVYINSSNQLSYRIGHTYNPAIMMTWYGSGGSSIAGLTADNCSVAVNDNGDIAVVYQKHGTYDLYYICGVLNNSTNVITWQPAHKYDTGIKPNVAINNSGYFLEVHQSENFASIYYNFGKLASGGTVSFKNSNEYKGVSLGTPSITPSIAMNASGQVLEVHESGGTNNSLYYMQFQVNTSTNNIDLICEQRYSISSTTDGMGGEYPTVTLNDNGDAMQMYQTSSNGYLYGCISKIWDRSNWMSSFQTKTIGQLSIPGSHDAGLYAPHGCTAFGSSGNTQTQFQSIANQLLTGIRYFDIRPAFNTINSYPAFGSSTSSTTIYTGHFGNSPAGIQGCMGEAMADLLNGVKSFLSSHSTEVVVLKFSHFYTTILNVFSNGSTTTSDYFFSDESITASQKQPQINQLISLIVQDLGSSVYHNSSSARLADIPLSSCKGKVIIVFDISELSGVSLTASSNSIYRYLDFNPASPNKTSADLVVFDKYSNTNDVNVMKSMSAPSDPDHPGQEYQLITSANHGGDLFLLSWTLTLQGQQVVNPAAYDILQLSQLATGILATEMVSLKNQSRITSTNFPNIIYVDACDGFVTDVCVWINNLGIK